MLPLYQAPQGQEITLAGLDFNSWEYVYVRFTVFARCQMSERTVKHWDPCCSQVAEMTVSYLQH